MKQKIKKILIVVTICLLAIGFATVTSILYIDGTITTGSKESEDFNIIFTKAIMDNQDVSNKVIDKENRRIINFSTPVLTPDNPKCVLEYTITNASSAYDAVVSIDIKYKNNGLVNIVNEFPEKNISSKGNLNGKVTIYLVDKPKETQNIDFSLIFNVTGVALKGTYINDKVDTYAYEGYAEPNSNINFIVQNKTYVTTADQNGYFKISGLTKDEYEIIFNSNNEDKND